MPTLDRSARDIIAQRYTRGFQRNYVRWKLAVDPAYAATSDLLAGRPMPLLDIGCGMGLLGHYLHACGTLTQYVGLDHDPRKITAGSQAARHGKLDSLMQLYQADIADLPPLQGHVVLLDILHYLPASRQAPLLQSAAKHLAPHGQLIIRNVLREPNWRFHMTRVEEYFLRVSGWMRNGAQHYPSAGEIRAPLEVAGLTVTIQPLHGRTPYNSYLIVAKHPNQPQGCTDQAAPIHAADGKAQTADA
jgi:2-polyprenyl-3-methyl-5-hydroxy-6-metoxy-1,4-benzoquinol methylase